MLSSKPLSLMLVSLHLQPIVSLFYTNLTTHRKIRRSISNDFVLDVKRVRREFLFGVAGLVTGCLGVQSSQATIDADPEKDPVKYLDEFFCVDKSDPSKNDFSWVLTDEERVRNRSSNIGKLPSDHDEKKWPNSASPIPRSLSTISDNGISDLENAIRESVTVGGSVNPLTHGR